MCDEELFESAIKHLDTAIITLQHVLDAHLAVMSKDEINAFNDDHVVPSRFVEGATRLHWLVDVRDTITELTIG